MWPEDHQWGRMFALWAGTTSHASSHVLDSLMIFQTLPLQQVHPNVVHFSVQTAGTRLKTLEQMILCIVFLSPQSAHYEKRQINPHPCGTAIYTCSSTDIYALKNLYTRVCFLLLPYFKKCNAKIFLNSFPKIIWKLTCCFRKAFEIMCTNKDYLKILPEGRQWESEWQYAINSA